ncbi:FixH family protein [Azonexus caeni]|uniref:FixH family protein n=1 Tax=Azonexus caeni TaxID=266126 RepID=UPI003A87E3BE
MTLKNDGKPWYKEPWPWLLMLGPGLVIIAAIVTIWLAVVSNDGLVTDDYYKQGLAVNQRLQRDHEASKLGLHADLMRSGQNLRLLVTTREGLAMPEVLTLRLAHPTLNVKDQLIEMKSEGAGFFGGVLASEVAGRWYVTLEDPAGQWRLHGEWHASLDEPLRLNAKAD